MTNDDEVCIPSLSSTYSLSCNPYALRNRYMEDCITKDEAIEMLQKEVPMKSKREVHIRMSGFPAYTTQVGWLGYSDEKIRTLSKMFLDRGFTAFKMKVGSDLEDDKRRLR